MCQRADIHKLPQVLSLWWCLFKLDKVFVGSSTILLLPLFVTLIQKAKAILEIRSKTKSDPNNSIFSTAKLNLDSVSVSSKSSNATICFFYVFKSSVIKFKKKFFDITNIRTFFKNYCKK